MVFRDEPRSRTLAVLTDATGDLGAIVVAFLLAVGMLGLACLVLHTLISIVR